MIIGLTGTLSSGKGIVAEFLKKKGFVYLSLSDELREIAKEKKIELTRENLQNLGNQLREEQGTGILAELVREKIKNQEYTKAIVDAIRNPAEIIELRKIKDFFLISVDAPFKIRFNRIVERNRESDPKTWDDFLKVDARDQREENEKGQQVRKCMEQAEFTIINDKELKDLEDTIRILFQKIGLKPSKIEKRKDYLSWDDYFMGIALFSAKRSKDPNTQVGACIVNPQKKIIGIGYNGFPLGCSDEELPWSREGSFLDTKYPYVCHAELNAVINSIGKDLTGCTIYVALFPCNECTKVIIQSGIKEIVYLSDKYADTDSIKASKIMMNQAGIRYRRIFPSYNEMKINFKEIQ